MNVGLGGVDIVCLVAGLLTLYLSDNLVFGSHMGAVEDWVSLWFVTLLSVVHCLVVAFVELMD